MEYPGADYTTMLFAIFTAVVTTLVLGLVFKWKRVKSFWKKKNVPHAPPHPLLGSLTFLMKKNAGLYMRDLYHQFKSPYVGIWLFWRPALVVNEPEVAKRILVKDADVFRDRHLGSGKTDPIGSLNIFTSNDPLWTLMRRRLTPVFTSSKLRSLSHSSVVKSKELCQRIRNDVEKKQKIDLRTRFADYTTDVIGTLCFGVESNATLTGDSALRRITLDFQKFSIWRGLSWSSIFFWPELVDIFRFKFFPKETTDFFSRIFKTVLESRGGYSGHKGENRDLLDALIKIKVDADKDDADVTESMLIAQAAILLQGGFDTSASLLTFAFYELAYLPTVQKKLYEELKAAKEELADKDFDVNTLSSLVHLNAVLNETMRLYPPMGWLDRISAVDYEIDDKLTIPKGMTVYVNVIGIQHDPEYFPEPKRFNPERFLPENEENIKPFTYLPFGAGPRNCIGMRLGLNNARMVLAHLLLEFELRPHPGEPKKGDSAIEKRGLLLMPGELYSVQFIPRNKT